MTARGVRPVEPPDLLLAKKRPRFTSQPTPDDVPFGPPRHREPSSRVAIERQADCMHTFLLTLGKGLKGPARMNGALFLGERVMYFLCASLGGGGYDFANFGPIGAALEGYKTTGAQPSVDEAALAALVASVPNSVAIPTEKIELMAKSMWTGSKILYDGGQKLVVWNPGFAGKFKETAKQWAASKGVKTAGL